MSFPVLRFIPSVSAAIGLASLCALLSPTLSFASDASTVTTASSAASKPAANTLRVNYARSGKDENLWGVYAWEGPQQPSKTWIKDRFMFNAKDANGGNGAYVDIPMAAGKKEIRFLLSNEHGHKNCNTDQNHPLSADIATQGQEIWVLQASCQILNAAPSTQTSK